MICALLTGAGGTIIRSAALSHNFVAQHLADNPDIEIVATLKSDPAWGAPKVSGSRWFAVEISFDDRAGSNREYFDRRSTAKYSAATSDNNYPPN